MGDQLLAFDGGISKQCTVMLLRQHRGAARPGTSGRSDTRGEGKGHKGTLGTHEGTQGCECSNRSKAESISDQLLHAQLCEKGVLHRAAIMSCLLFPSVSLSTVLKGQAPPSRRCLYCLRLWVHLRDVLLVPMMSTIQPDFVLYFQFHYSVCGGTQPSLLLSYTVTC